MAERDAVLANSPLGYWRLQNGSGTDEMGLNNATPANLTSAAALVADSSGSSSFNGTTSKLTLGTPALLKPAFPMSVECWFKTSTTTDMRLVRWRDYGYWINIGDASGINEFGFQDSGAGIHFARYVNLGGDVADNVRHHIVGTYDGSNVKVYFDGGAAKETNPATAAINYTDNQLAFGVNGDDPTAWFNGAMADVAIYGSALTQAQVQAHYDARDVTPKGAVNFQNPGLL